LKATQLPDNRQWCIVRRETVAHSAQKSRAVEPDPPGGAYLILRKHNRGFLVPLWARNRALHYLAGSYELSDEFRHQLTQVVYGYAGRCDENAARKCLEWMRGEPNKPMDARRVEKSGWSAKLTRTIILKDGPILHTLADVRAFILNGPEHIQECQTWQHTAQLLLDAAEDAGRIEDATRQVEFALFLEERLVLK
jgi:hypothetical protein